MPTFNFPNGTAPDEVLISTATAVPAFPQMLLFFTWVLIFFGGIQKQSKRFGYSDTPQWAVIASMATFLLSLVMTIKDGIISLPILMIVLSITILSAVWFFMSRGRFE